VAVESVDPFLIFRTCIFVAVGVYTGLTMLGTIFKMVQILSGTDPRKRLLRTYLSYQLLAIRIRPLAASIVQRPLVGDATVLQHRLADELDFDAALEAFHRSDERVVRIVIGRRPGVRRDLVVASARAHRQRLADKHPARWGLPGGRDDVRAGLVHPSGRVIDAERCKSKAARLAIDEAPKDAR
jgi:hypothetical protein